MLSNHFKIAWRKIIRQKGFTVLNLLGLAVGLAATFLMVAYVYHQYTFDRFHEHTDRLFIASGEYRYGDQNFNVARFSSGFGPVMQERVPGVDRSVRLFPQNKVVLSPGDGPEKQNEAVFHFADSNFLEVFTFELLRGNKKEVLADPFSVLLTPAMAEKYFGAEDPVGKTLEYLPPSGGYLVEKITDPITFTIKGIIAPAPGNSNIQYNFIASLSSLRTIIPAAFENRIAQLGAFETYFLLKDDQDATEVQSQLESVFNEGQTDEDARVAIHIQTLPDVYLNEAVRKKLGLFVGIALLILLLAIVNYASLTTARATQRAREVGVRKALGARRSQLMGQFFGESALMVLLAFFLAVGLSKLTLPLINRLADTQFSFGLFAEWGMLSLVTGILVGSIFLAGSYPALALSRFLPAKVLRGGQGATAQGERTRRLLLIFQFVVSAGLIVCSLVMQSQMSFLGKRDLGFDRDQLLVVPFTTDQQGALSALKSSFLQEPGVLAAGISTSVPFDPEGSSIYFANTPSGKDVSVFVSSVDKDFLSMLKVNWLAGNTEGTLSFGADKRVIINETAYREMGLEEGLGERLMQGGIGGEQGFEVSGIVRDYTFSNYKSEVSPQLMIELSEEKARSLTTPAYLTVRLSPGIDVQGAISRFEEIYDGFDPVKSFDFFFIDDAYNALFHAETRTAALFNLFTILAILIACLGLFGLSAFLAERRTKEIGIRKVFGATVTNIVALLSKDFLYLVSIALIIALPLAWYFMSQWLEDFAFRIELEWWLFVLAAVLALGIAFLTVSFQSIKAALANPVKSLRNE